MEINVLKDEKGEMDVQVDNLTVVELLRSYLNKDSSIKLAAWKREHPSKPPILHIEAGNAKKALQDAIKAVQKDLSKYTEEFKKLK
jgi:DNA-directed RNA polymerase subunit L